eukprot:TRINITY_DN44946_c0_g1_i1.p1 TRINITY_DN44946_c0_g1~~TRINITY_DN44946_c0_g1_i1.p1  ORF type:complete len:242 (+),score=31.50 TRINITY_DN44946_c0_g1_i1:67-792(+)
MGSPFSAPLAAKPAESFGTVSRSELALISFPNHGTYFRKGSASSASTVVGSDESLADSDTDDEDWQSARGSPDLPRRGPGGHLAVDMSPCDDDGFDRCIVAAFIDLAGYIDAEDETASLVLKAVRMLMSCLFSVDDICVVLSFASVYFQDFIKLVGATVHSEASRILTLAMFLAHCYVLDEHCPLRVWHAYLFEDFCDMATLNGAVVDLLTMRGNLLRVEAKELKWRHERLLASSGIDMLN